MVLSRQLNNIKSAFCKIENGQGSTLLPTVEKIANALVYQMEISSGMEMSR